jgi:malate dehydrogenase
MSAHHNERAAPAVPDETPLPPIVVALTGAAGQLAYSLAFLIAGGALFGPTRRVALRLLDVPLPGIADKLEALQMELEDTAPALLASCLPTTDYAAAFADADVALLVGARPRAPGMERRDLLAANAGIFAGQGAALDRYAKKTVLVLVVGNPANTNALIAAQHAPSLPRSQFACLTRLDHNRAAAVIAKRLNETPSVASVSAAAAAHAGAGAHAGTPRAPVPIAAASVRNVIVWGNHSSTQFPDARFAVVNAFPRAQESASVPALLGAGGREWLRGDFVRAVQGRGKAVMDKRGLSSAGSAAVAIADCVRDWWRGSNGEIVSMGLYTESGAGGAPAGQSHYGVPADLVFSFPVVCEGRGVVRVVADLTLDDFAARMVRASAEELLLERAEALPERFAAATAAATVVPTPKAVADVPAETSTQGASPGASP